MAALPPPPTNDATGSYAWLEWFRQLRTYISTVGSVPWNIIDFAGSTLSSIASRSHQVLQALQGGTTGEYYHLTSSEYTGSGTGDFARMGNPTLAGLTNSGDITFTGVGKRIKGDFNNATIADRLLFQTSNANQNTFVGIQPNGTATAAGFELYDRSGDLTNCARVNFRIDFGASVSFRSAVSGSGTYLPMLFFNNGVEQVRIAVDGTFTAGGVNTAPALKVVPNATPSTQRHVLITAGAAAGNPTIGVSGGILAISASVAITGVVSTSGYTVATLPGGTVGDRAYVTDALAPAYGAAVAGGGAVTIPVFYNGAAWICA